MGKSYLSSILCLVVVLTGTLGASLSIPRISAINSALRQNQTPNQGGLYLPDVEAIKFISFGYRNAASHFMWFKTISYFGEHFSTDRDLRWLKHMCFLTLELDPQSRHAYQFCSNMLSWEADDPNGAVEILNKAVTNFPDEWLFLYLRGFTKHYFLKDNAGARDDFVASSHKNNAPSLVMRLAAKQLAQLNTPDAAIEFLSGMLATEKDKRAREALLGRLKEAVRSRDIGKLDQAVEIFAARTGSKPRHLDELVSSGIVTKVENDPFGGTYLIDETSGKVSSTSLKPAPRGGRR